MAKYTAVHIHTKSGSSRDALLSVKDLYEFLQKNNISGTVTDHGTLGAWAEVLKLKKDYPDVKIVLGIEAYTNFRRDRMFHLRNEIKKLKENKKRTAEQNAVLKAYAEEFDEIKKYNHLVILAKNQHGLQNLIELNNMAYRNFYEKPLITHQNLFDLPRQHGDRGLIITSSCLAGIVPQMILKDKNSDAFEMTGIFKEEFRDDYFLELQLNGMDMQKKVNEKLLQFSKKLKIQTVVSTDAHYASDEFNRAHEIFLLIQGNQKVSDIGKSVYKVSFKNKKGEIKKKKFDLNDEFRGVKVKKFAPGMRFGAKEVIKKGDEKTKTDLEVIGTETVSKVWTIETNLVLRNEADMLKARKQLSHDELSEQELKKALKNNSLIDSMTENIDLDRNLKLPRFENENELLKKEAAKGLIRIRKSKDKNYIDRLKHELKVICDCGFASYFLILHDLFQFLKKEEIGTGSGRGSSCGSLTAYLLGITRIDPLDKEQYGEGLVFERFLDYGRSGKAKIIKIDTEEGTREFQLEEEVNIKRKGREMTVKAKDLIEGDDLI